MNYNTQKAIEAIQQFVSQHFGGKKIDTHYTEGKGVLCTFADVPLAPQNVIYAVPEGHFGFWAIQKGVGV